jgi:hypothetical protein
MHLHWTIRPTADDLPLRRARPRDAASIPRVLRDALSERSPGSQPGGRFLMALRKVLTLSRSRSDRLKGRRVPIQPSLPPRDPGSGTRCVRVALSSRSRGRKYELKEKAGHLAGRESRQVAKRRATECPADRHIGRRDRLPSCLPYGQSASTREPGSYRRSQLAAARR